VALARFYRGDTVISMQQFQYIVPKHEEFTEKKRKAIVEQRQGRRHEKHAK